MNSTKKQARSAGFLYLLIAIIAPFGLIYVPSTLIVTGDAAATADRIRASESLFRIGIATNLASGTIFIFVVLALYRLLKRVNETHASLMATLALVSVPVSLVNALNDIAALICLSGADFLSVFEPHQLDALAYLFLRLHSQGSVVAAIFWGLWLFPFGALVIRSGFVPRALGVLLMIAGTAYLLSSSTSLLLPQYRHLVGQIAMVMEFGELPIIFWLLIWGAKEQRSDATASS